MSRSAKASIDRIEEIEERATEGDRLAYELYIAGERRSPISNQLYHFLTDPRMNQDRAKYRRIAKRALAWPEEPTCLICHCTEMNACEGGCGWVFISRENNWGVCSSCVPAMSKKAGLY